MNLVDAIKGRRSVRKYHDTPIADNTLEEILEAAVWAPSGVNLQPWYFVVIKSPEERKKLEDLLVLTSRRLKPSLQERFKNNPEVVSDTLTFMESMGGAPVCILAFLNKEYEGEQYTSSIQSVSAAIQNLLLAAYEKGIGTCWTTGSIHVKNEIRERYGEGLGEYICMVSMGYCDFPSYVPKRKENRIKYL